MFFHCELTSSSSPPPDFQKSPAQVGLHLEQLFAYVFLFTLNAGTIYQNSTRLHQQVLSQV